MHVAGTRGLFLKIKGGVGVLHNYRSRDKHVSTVSSVAKFELKFFLLVDTTSPVHVIELI